MRTIFPTLLFLLAACFAGRVAFCAPENGEAATSATSAATGWWNADWRERHEVIFKCAGSGVEMGQVTLRPGFARRKNPYDVRAVNAKGETLPVKVLSFTPGGDTTFLVAPDPGGMRAEWRVYFYLDNPAAIPDTHDFLWREPFPLVGPMLNRTDQRHGEWRWLADSFYGSVHQSSGERSTHSITALTPVSIHPQRTRFAQMVWLDPAAPPSAIALELYFDSGIMTAYWTNAAELPANAIAPQQAHRVGALPVPGKWTLLEARAGALGLRSSEPLKGIGFTSHDGGVKWGPTALGAMQIRGQEVSCQTLDASGKIVEVNLDPSAASAASPEGDGPRTFYAAPSRFKPGCLQMDVLAAPLFLKPGEPLRLTFSLAPSREYVGKLYDCFFEIKGDAVPGPLLRETVSFIGGDCWQKMTQIAPDALTHVRRLDARAVDARGVTLASATLRLAPAGPMDNLLPEGGLLQDRATGDVVCFLTGEAYVPEKGRKISKAKSSAPVLLLTPALAPPGLPKNFVSIQSDDDKLGLPKRLHPLVRRGAAEWTAAAAHAAGGYSSAEIRVDEDMIDIGVTPQNAGDFLAGLLAVLRNAGVPARLDLEPLRQKKETPRLQALLLSCMQAKALQDEK